ncbi:hypothetical protein ACP70R_014017 [Stipagrostis hirtigluma subsp. patula]
MSMTPRGRSSHRRGRCKCAGGDGCRGTPCCFNPLRSLFRCPGRGRGRSRSRHRRHQRTPSRVRDVAPADVGAQSQRSQEEEPSFFVYAMPNQGAAGGGGGGADHKKKKKKNRKARMPSFGSCFRRKKKERKAKAAAAAAVSARRPALTPASSLLTHPPYSPPPEKAQAVTPSMTQPPSPAPTENGSISSPAPPARAPATPRPDKQSPEPDSARSPLALQRPQPKQVEGLEIVEVATGERLSTHDLGLIEMVGSSASEESSAKSSLEYVNETPPPPPPAAAAAAAKRTVVERGAEVVKARELPCLWLNGKTLESRARERFVEPLVAAEAEELWAHHIACSRVHAAMLADTVSSSKFEPMALMDVKSSSSLT